MADTPVYEVIHTSPELKTVYDYIAEINSPAFNYIDNTEAFLQVKNLNGQTNREAIEATYTSRAEKEKYIGGDAKVLLLKIGTRLAIEQKKVNKAGLMTEGLEITSYNVAAFKARALAELETKEDYKTYSYNKPIKGQIQKGSVKKIHPDLTVWVWCRSLASAANNFEGEIFNITPFIEKISTDVSKTGGNFELVLPPLVCELTKDGRWIVKKKNLEFYQGKNLSLQKNDYVAQGNLYEEVDGQFLRSRFLFHSIISPNDVVWIRYETLKVEGSQRISDTEQLYISKFNLPDRIYDMIGLVDINGITIQSANIDVSIQISGRDLSKLFIEDGTYVFNLELTQGMLGGPGSSQDSGLSRRLVADKSLLYLGLYFNNTIEKVIKFVINQLSNIQIVPDTLFEAYGDRRNTRFEEKQTDVDAETKIATQKQQFKQQAIQAIRNIRLNSKNNLPNPIDEKKQIQVIYQEMYRFLFTIREKKVRATEGGATSSWFSFSYINDRGVSENIQEGSFPTFFAIELFNLQETRYVPEAIPVVIPIDQLLDLEAAGSSYTEELVKKPTKGIWQIIKLVLDESVTNRKIIDSSLSSANGSLLNYLKKICQEPFVEYFMDTYSDMYHLIVRKPPTDRIGILTTLQSEVTTELIKDTSTTEERVTPAVITIQSDDVLYEQLAFNDSEAISWYHLQPQANFQGGDQYSLAYLPAIFLPEYAEIWGSRPMQLIHNYLPSILKDASQNSLDVVQKQTVEDLRYVIESTAYLPFTRKGVIKINGDRRCKVGNIIRYEPTGEIFHIDHVKQEFAISDSSIDRTTTLQVSRGMVEQLIYGIPTSGRDGESVDGYISYFNIVNVNPTYEYKDITSFTEKRVKIGTKTVTNNNSTSTESTQYEIASIQNGKNQNLHLLSKYRPYERNKFIELIGEINRLGYSVVITSGVRSYIDQVGVYNKDKRNAKPGTSRHETGLAIDINLIDSTGQVYGLRVGKKSVNDWLSTGVPQKARSMGFSWGGQDFGGYKDVVHFQLPRNSNNGTTTTEDVYEVQKTPVKQTSLDFAKVFSNIKVNKAIFDFFLRKEQFNYRTVNDKGVYDQSGIKTAPAVIIKAKKK